MLELLRSAGDGYISGEEIAGRLGVSRTAVWKHIRALKAAGYEIDSHARKGYTLLETPDLLLPQEIQPEQHLRHQSLPSGCVPVTMKKAEQYSL